MFNDLSGANRGFSRRHLAAGIVLAGLTALLAILLWPSRCPVDLKWVSMEPSGIIDADGTEPWLVTLTMTNCCRGFLILAPQATRCEAKVGGKWTEAETVSSVTTLMRRESRLVLVLVPSAAEACRLRIQYAPEPWRLRLLKMGGALGLWRHAWVQRVTPASWLQPGSLDYRGPPRHWQFMRPEVAFPHPAVADMQTRLP
jgi:hypothetical protein